MMSIMTNRSQSYNMQYFRLFHIYKIVILNSLETYDTYIREEFRATDICIYLNSHEIFTSQLVKYTTVWIVCSQCVQFTIHSQNDKHKQTNIPKRTYNTMPSPDHHETRSFKCDCIRYQQYVYGITGPKRH